MGSFSRAARFLVLLQVALFVVSAVFMSGSVAVAREISGGGLGPVCINGPCKPSGPYTRPCRTIYGCPPLSVIVLLSLDACLMPRRPAVKVKVSPRVSVLIPILIHR